MNIKWKIILLSNLFWSGVYDVFENSNSHPYVTRENLKFRRNDRIECEMFCKFIILHYFSGWWHTKWFGWSRGPRFTCCRRPLNLCPPVKSGCIPLFSFRAHRRSGLYDHAWLPLLPYFPSTKRDTFRRTNKISPLIKKLN